jgi:hypothetical protein
LGDRRIGGLRAPVRSFAFIALEAAQLTGVRLETSDAGHVANMFALRPAAQGREFAPASRPASEPQAPFRTLQAANRLAEQWANFAVILEWGMELIQERF